MLGLGIGGTFTDFAWAHAHGRLVVAKRPTAPEDPARALLQGLASLATYGPWNRFDHAWLNP